MCLASDKLFDKRLLYVVFIFFAFVSYSVLMLAFPIYTAVNKYKKNDTVGVTMSILWLMIGASCMITIVCIIKTYWTRETETNDRLRLIDRI